MPRENFPARRAILDGSVPGPSAGICQNSRSELNAYARGQLGIPGIAPVAMAAGGGEGSSRINNRGVVLGGGVAGALLAKNMQFHADVVLIDPKEYFEIPWAQLRSMVEPSFAERSVINHTDYLTNERIITSSAVSVTEAKVLTANGDSIAYDYLVIATGHADSTPGN